MGEEQQEKCIFCQIVGGKIPVDPVYESADLMAFTDISPKAPVHILIIPKSHIEPKKDMTDVEYSLLKDVLEVAKEIAAEKGIADSGFRLLINIGPDSGQEIDHMHFHLLGGRKLGGLG